MNVDYGMTCDYCEKHSKYMFHELDFNKEHIHTMYCMDCYEKEHGTEKCDTLILRTQQADRTEKPTPKVLRDTSGHILCGRMKVFAQRIQDSDDDEM